MSTIEITSKIEALKELESLIEEAKAEAEALRDEIKTEMQKGGGNLFNGSGQRSRSDVDFMGAAQRGNPGVLSQREMTVGFWRGLDGDGGS